LLQRSNTQSVVANCDRQRIWTLARKIMSFRFPEKFCAFRLGLELGLELGLGLRLRLDLVEA